MLRSWAIITGLLLACIWGYGQKMNIYLLPGQGSDERVFQGLVFDTIYQTIPISYGTPAKGTTMCQYACEIVKQIDTSNHFIIIGFSLGGMIGSEISGFCKNASVIIISSAKNRDELPLRYRFQRTIPIYKIIPAKMLHAGAKCLQPIVEPDRNKHKALFKSMLGSKDPVYIKRTIEMIVRWDKRDIPGTIVHIHGSNDHTLPSRKVNPDYLIPGGSHMMVLTRAEKIYPLLHKVMEEMLMQK